MINDVLAEVKNMDGISDSAKAFLEKQITNSFPVDNKNNSLYDIKLKYMAEVAPFMQIG